MGFDITRLSFLRTGATLALFPVASYAITLRAVKYPMKIEVQPGK